MLVGRAEHISLVGPFTVDVFLAHPVTARTDERVVHGTAECVEPVTVGHHASIRTEGMSAVLLGKVGA
ncbi:hypothetical protein AAW14_05990 [Streptomyces hygroscopicus]|uniref:hypothetical protein n=1 Tax=Streptomyces hygroscopicus TaxID=1912 RepID=UPI00223F359B|nr:hypothetical protein [Streptomyces hygroscopicus]MCW7941598.1 hypothetical protein [Streptomyces hygroscopicus]